jgi:hypothetical protein
MMAAILRSTSRPNQALRFDITGCSWTSKADLIAALKTAFAYCDKAYDAMTDASGGQTVKLFGTDTPRLGALNFNNVHNWEHYGNLVTYMRIKNVVPPSSEQAQMPAPKQEKPESQPKWHLCCESAPRRNART